MQLGTSRRLIGRGFSAGEVLDGHDAFLRRQVREQRRRHHIADCIDALLSGLLIFIDLNETLFDFDLRLSRPSPSVKGMRPTATRSISASRLHVFAF